MPQGSHAKAGKSNPKKQKITKVSKKGSSVTKKTPKKSVVERKKLQKALESTVRDKVETELRAKAGSSTLDKKAAPAKKRGRPAKK